MSDEMRQMFGIDLVIRLRDVRLLCGLTQAEVAKRSGVGMKTISSYETGARIDQIKVVQLLKILRVYGVAPAAFFRWRPERLTDFVLSRKSRTVN
jgi:transcriptional regulator with XRE-family HTH domain